MSKLDRELVERYGPDILSIRRQSIPPRKARNGNLLAIMSKPAARAKFREELRRAGSRIYGDRHRVTREPTPGPYTFTDCLPAFTKHALGVLGEVARRDVRPLYGRRDGGHEPQEPFAAGDKVLIQRGPFASFRGVVVGKRSKRGWWVDVSIFGRLSRCTLATQYLRIDPG